jgi:hypothetical protein
VISFFSHRAGASIIIIKEEKMTVEQLLTLVDATKENDLPDDVKITWIRDVEGRVLSEIHRMPIEEIRLPECVDDVLTLPESYARAYLLYVIAMIELSNGSYTGHQKIMQEYESSVKMYARYYIRNRK